MERIDDIHASHRASVENTIVSIMGGEPRFGRTVECLDCGYNGAEAVSGSDIDRELFEPCKCAKE